MMYVGCRDGAPASLRLRGLFRRNPRFRERRVGHFSSADGGLRRGGASAAPSIPRKGHRPLTLFQAFVFHVFSCHSEGHSNSDIAISAVPTVSAASATLKMANSTNSVSNISTT